MTYTILGSESPLCYKPYLNRLFPKRSSSFPNKKFRKICIVTSELDESTGQVITKEDQVYINNGFEVQEQDQQVIQKNREFLQQIGYNVSLPGSSIDGDNLKPGSPSVEDALKTLKDSPKRLTVDQISKIFPYELDTFQRKGLNILGQKKNLVVCAPTGSGKTSIATGATFSTLMKGQRIIYTTPLKALSNQKYNEFKEVFGEKRVGLQTGDVVYNANAEIVIMTTEILRNQLYREDSEAYMGVIQNVASIGLVVLDEVHYLGDRYRGTVWEEIIINCPKHIQMLAMSATVLNPEDLGRWIEHIHGECQTIQTSIRPVPLKFWYGFKHSTYKENQADDDQDSLERLNTQTKIVELRDRKRDQNINPELQEHQIKTYVVHSPKKNKDSPSDPDEDINEDDNFDEDALIPETKIASKVTEMEGPDKFKLIYEMQQKKMLPAIYFIFSRLKCDQDAIALYEKGIKLVNEKEFAQIFQEISNLKRENPDAIREHLVEPMCAGVASHHAGCLPAWKALTESLFQKGLVKVVFATETLAAGINMPAKTTVISTLARKRDMEIQRLTNNELLQMSGRAGRRGYDYTGNTILIYNSLSKPRIALRLLNRNAEPIESQFTATYSMVLNLLSTQSLEQAHKFVEKSFMTFMSYKGDGRIKRQLRDIKEDIFDLEKEIQIKESTNYKKMVQEEKIFVGDTVVKARQKITELITQLIDDRAVAVEEKIKDAKFPVHVSVEIRKKMTGAHGIPAICLGVFKKDFIQKYKKKEGMPANIISQIKRLRKSQKKSNFLVCLGSNNKVYVVHPGVIAGVGEKFDMEEEVRDSLLQQILNDFPSLDWTEFKHDMTGFSADGTSGMLQYSYIITPRPKVEEIETGDRHEQIQQVTGQLKVLKKQRTEVRKKTKRMPKDYRNTRGKLSGVKFERSSPGEKQKVSQDERTSAEIAELHEKIQNREYVMRKYKKKLFELKNAPDNHHWLEFQAVKEVLLHFQALNERLKPTDLGMIARELRGDHELFLALALTQPQLTNLSASELAAVLSSLMAGPMFYFKDKVHTSYKATDRVVEIVDSFDKIMEDILDVQEEYDLDRPMYVDKRLCGVVQAWAQGESWSAIVSDCTVDEGDIGRLLMRTIDFLKQVIYIEQLWEGVKSNCKLALLEMDRAPVSEVYL